MVKAHSHGDGSPFIAYATASCDPTEVMVSHAIGYGAAQGCVDNSTVDSASFGCADQYFSYDWHTVHFYASAKCCKKR